MQFMSRVRMRQHVPCAKPFSSVDIGGRESHVTVRERTEEMKSPQNNDNQECTTSIQNPSKCFVPEERSHLQQLRFKWKERKKRNNREFKKRRQRRHGQRRLNNELLFHLRISQYSRVIQVVSHCQNYLATEYGTQR